MADKPNNLGLSSELQVLMMLYQVNRDNQELYINQQWKVIYYALLLYGAIFAVYLKLNNFESYMIIAGVSIFFISTVFICLIEQSLNTTRKADKDIRKKNELFKIIDDIFVEPYLSISSFIFIFLLLTNLGSCIFLICAVLAKSKIS
jgi:hypothetical protein